MPLQQSGSPEAVSQNIRTERAAGRPQNQAVAIAMRIKDKARRQKAHTVLNPKG